MSISEDVKEFLVEGRDYLEKVEPALIQLQQGQVEKQEKTETINSAFRTFHSIKGVAGFLGLSNVQKLTHRVEEVLDLVRSQKTDLSEDILLVTLHSCDLMKIYFDHIESTGNDLIYEVELDKMLSEIESIMTIHNDKDFRFAGQKGEIIHDSVLFSCFLEPSFVSSFVESLHQNLSEAEMDLLDVLDSPSGWMDILKKCSEQMDKIDRNLLILGYSNATELIKAFTGTFEQRIKQNKPFDPSELGTLFGVFEWIKSFSLHKEINEDVLLKRKNLEVELGQLEILKADKPLYQQAEQSSGLEKSDKVIQKLKAKSEIRIEVDKIDKLVEFIEELGVIAGVISRDLTSTNSEENNRIQAISKLRQITSSLQDVAMSVRLISMSATFNKMNRLTYDVAQKLGKKVRLVTKGEQAEIDKTMLEAIQDPLVHLFRNAIDHGIEMPNERVNNGKSETGEIELSAWLGGGEFFISIKDDGKGVDPEAIYEKAIEKGIITPELILSDKEKRNLIFEAGFSTASEVTDFSGRGVGMDVVKKSIELLNGVIDLDSEVGKGSTIIISFPLTSTIVETVLVRVGKMVYSIRVSNIKEFFKSSLSKTIEMPDGTINIRLRKEIYPLIQLRHLMHNQEAIHDFDEATYILVENKDRKIVLMVDEILGTNQSVVKELPKYFNKVNGVSGCSVIGTNSNDVSWTLDINGLISDRI